MKQYYIKERINPQLGTYYVACGQMSKAAARRSENPLYGENIMHSFETESAYLARIQELKRLGEKFQ
jgi:hypothetical protein